VSQMIGSRLPKQFRTSVLLQAANLNPYNASGLTAGVENGRFEKTWLTREVYANVSNAVQVDAKVILKTL
jgi:hypothetical protein